MNMSKEFEGKVALITGGSSGIGRSTAIAFAKKGAKIVIASRREKESQETVAIIKEMGSKAIFFKTDITQAIEVQNLVNQTINTYSRLDYAFNNAGTEGILGPSIEQTEENWNQIINTNLKGVWLSMKYQIPEMLKNGEGAIVNNASVFGLVGSPNFSIYCASKHGLIGLTKAVALEQATAGIRINSVCPGAIQTDMVDRAFGKDNESKAKAQVLAGYPIGRIGQPEEVANAVVWLCSDAASFITGHSLPIDGGFTVQ